MKFKVTLLCVGVILLSFFQQAIGQTIAVTGTVKSNSTGDPLAGATISVQGTTKSISTDAAGNFTIMIPKGAMLVVSYVGTVTQKRRVFEAGILNFSLDQSATNTLNDVVVIGYGTQKVTKVSGAISTVKSEDIERLNPVRAEDALQGRASGVTVTSSGSPGANPTVLIRGIPSYTGNGALVVVDGAIESISDLNSIPPTDIESINVLKDAATEAIYGVKGGNGVILITTKGGRRNQKPEFTVNTNYGIQQVQNEIGVLNASEYATIINEGSVASGGSIIFPDISKFGVGTNWQDQIFKNAPIASANISARGGSANSTYFLSGGYLGQSGIVGGGDKSYFNRSNLTANLTFDLAPRVHFLANTSFANIKGGGVAENSINSVISNALNFDPTQPILNDIPNTYGKYSISPYILSEIFNPLTQLDDTHNESNTNKLYGKLEFQFDLLKNLKFTSRYGYTYVEVTGKSFTPLSYYGDAHINSTLNSDGSTRTGDHNSVAQSINNYYNATFENFINYNFKINEDNHFETVLGMSVERNTGSSINGSRQDVPFNSWNYADISAATGTAANSGIGLGDSKYENRNLSYFARAIYDYKEKYLVTAEARRDGSYAFGIDNKFANFYAGSVGWVISKENFFKSNFISFLKPRVSYGTSGNDNVSPQYQQISTSIYIYNQGQNAGYTFGNEPTSTGATVASFKNDDLGWETDKQLNAGFDIRFLKDKFSFTGDYFQKNTSGLLFTPTLSLYLGTASAPSANIGSTKTSGVDMDLGFNSNIGKDFNISTNVTFTAAKNLVEQTNNGIITSGTYGIPAQSVTRFQQGYTPFYFYGYKTDGLFQTQQEIDNSPTQTGASPGDIKYVDVNHDGKIDDSDRTNIGNPFPRFTMGWGLSLNYKGIDFSTFLYLSVGNDVYRGYERNLAMTNKFRSVLARWTGPGTTNNADDPRYSFIDGNDNTRVSDRYVEDGSFLKIKDIQLGYTLPPSMYRNKIFSKIRIYAQVKNAYTFTKYSGFDPEIGSNGDLGNAGIDRGEYPQARTYSMGIDFRFQ